jgi:hypothetical protein
MNTSLPLDAGQLTETGLRRSGDGGLEAQWVLSWPEQRAAGVETNALQAYFGAASSILIFGEQQFTTGR